MSLSLSRALARVRDRLRRADRFLWPYGVWDSSVTLEDNLYWNDHA